jgi:hypothetical protein
MCFGVYTALAQQYIWRKISVKTRSISGIRFINEKVHPGNMEIREVQEGNDIDKAIIYIWNEDPLNHP